MTAFVAVDDRRRAGGDARMNYWLYRPTLGWERVGAPRGAAEVAAARDDPAAREPIPRLVPLETLAGRNHVEFPPGEEPPWRWQVESVYP